MNLNPSEISDLIKSRIQNMQLAANARNEGTVVSVTDGICRVHGLTDVPCRAKCWNSPATPSASPEPRARLRRRRGSG
jgi:hypothetical protein